MHRLLDGLGVTRGDITAWRGVAGVAAATGFATGLAWLVPALRWDLVAPVLLILIGGWMLTRTALRDRGKDSTGGPEELEISAE